MFDEKIPAPYDNRNGSRTVTEAMRELQAFRATRKPHDLGVLPFAPVFKRNQPEAESEPEVTPKPAKRKKSTS